jgi:hypothetical protein
LRYFIIYITSNISPPLGAIIFFEHHTTRFFNTSGRLFEDSRSVGFSTRTNKNTVLMLLDQIYLNELLF